MALIGLLCPEVLVFGAKSPRGKCRAFGHIAVTGFGSVTYGVEDWSALRHSFCNMVFMAPIECNVDYCVTGFSNLQKACDVSGGFSLWEVILDHSADK